MAKYLDYNGTQRIVEYFNQKLQGYVTNDTAQLMAQDFTQQLDQVTEHAQINSTGIETLGADVLRNTNNIATLSAEIDTLKGYHTPLTDQAYRYKDLWYGLLINLNNHGHNTTDGKLQRVGNPDLHRLLPIQSQIHRFVMREDGSVAYKLHPDDSTKKEDGTPANLNAVDGDVMLYKPAYYRKFEFIGTDYLLVAISELPLPGFVRMKEKACSPWPATINRTTNIPVSASFLTWDSNGNVVYNSSHVPVFTSNAAQFRGGNNDATVDNTLNSLLGRAGTNFSKDELRGMCRAKGDRWHFGAWRIREELCWLMAIEFGEINLDVPFNPNKTAEGFAQGGLGINPKLTSYSDWNKMNGARPVYPNGLTAKLGNHSGVVPYTVYNWYENWKTVAKNVQICSYRGWEQPKQHIIFLNDDAIVHVAKPSEGGAAHLYLCSDPLKFASPNDHDTIAPEGYELAGTLPSFSTSGFQSGFITARSITPDGAYSIPSSVEGGAGNKDYGDKFSRANATNTDGKDGWYQVETGIEIIGGEPSGVWAMDTVDRNGQKSVAYGFNICFELSDNDEPK